MIVFNPVLRQKHENTAIVFSKIHQIGQNHLFVMLKTLPFSLYIDIYVQPQKLCEFSNAVFLYK